MLLAKDDRKQTVWHNAALWDNVELLGRIWKWAEEQLISKEVNNRILLGRIGKRAEEQLAAERGK